MSDLKLYNLKTKELKLSQQLTIKQMKDYIQKHLQPLLGLHLLAEDFLVDGRNNQAIETLCLDENYQIVIIEYRVGKFGKIINKGLIFVDYIKQNQSVFKMMVRDKLGPDVVQAVNYEPRLIVIGDDFNHYDEHAVQQINTVIDLIKIGVYDKEYLILEKNYQSMQMDHSCFTYQWKNDKEKSIYQAMNQFLLSLGNEVIEFGRDHYLMYRKIKTFMYVSFSSEIEITLIFQTKVAKSIPRENVFVRTYKVKTENDFIKIQDDVELSYDQN